jgi:hypothetical protein
MGLGQNSALDVTMAANCFTLDTLTDVALGRSLDMLTSEKNRWILLVLPKAVKFFHTVGPSVFPRDLFLRWLTRLV